MSGNKSSINMKKTGLKLQRMSEQNGYSVKDIQNYLCLSCPQSVYRWYKGSILPSVDNLLRLSELFHVHMEELLVKEYSDHLFEEITCYANNSQAFYKRMKAYCAQLAA